jgi:release factor glutamine methyltransferase
VAVLPMRLPSSSSRATSESTTLTLQSIIWRLAHGVTVGSALNSATQRLKEAELEGAWLDAQVILAHVLGVERSWLFAHAEESLSDEQAEHFTQLVARRIDYEPVAYLVGRKEFYGLDLLVDKRVLIPRPETEMLVDEVLREVAVRDRSPIRIADIGTGSGAIALAIALNDERTIIHAVDSSRKALAVARVNLQRLDARGQVSLYHGDLTDALPERVDIIVANLPYIGRAAYDALEPTVRAYEPRQALHGGDDGLDIIARLLRRAPLRLNEGGAIYLEIGYDQGAAVALLARNLMPHYLDIAVHQDYQGHDRMVAVTLP